MSAAHLSRLDNGLAVIARPNRAARSVAIHLIVQAGASLDPAGKEGTAALVADLLDRGAGSRSAAQIAALFDDLGVAYSAGARRDSIEIDLRLLSQHLDPVLEHLRLMVTEADFPETEVQRQRGQMLTTLAERDQDTSAVADMTLWGALFPKGHPYGHPRLGTRDSVPRIERKDLVEFHRSFLRPARAILSLAGDFDPKRALDLAARTFGRWDGQADGGKTPATRTPIPDPPAPERVTVEVRPIEGKSQSDIAVGFPGLKRVSPDLPACLVLNNILGEFSLGGRLGTAIRERAGLAYYAFSHINAGLGAGPFVARAGVAPDRVRKALDLMRKTIEQLVRRGITNAELADSRQALAASIPRRLETNPETAAVLADAIFFGFGIDYPERLPDLIRAVSKSEVEAAAQKYLTPKRCVLVVAGTAPDKEILA